MFGAIDVGVMIYGRFQTGPFATLVGGRKPVERDAAVQHYSSMTDGLRRPELRVPAAGRQPALIMRPWRAADVPALAARGRGIAPAAVRAVTDWVFDAFAGASLRQIMLVNDIDNPASCRVAAKAGYPFRELSPANPPHWFTDGHIHMRLPGSSARFLKVFCTNFGICDNALGLRTGSGEDLLGFTLCVSDRLVRSVLRELQDLGRHADLDLDLGRLAGLEQRHACLLST